MAGVIGIGGNSAAVRHYGLVNSSNTRAGPARRYDLKGRILSIHPLFSAGALLKRIFRAADELYMHKSALITSLMLAVSAATFTGLSEWANSGVGSSSPESSDAATVSSYSPAGTGTFTIASTGGGGATAPTLVAATAPAYTIRRVVPEVRLQFTVTDPNGKLVQGLSAADVRVLDDSSPVDRYYEFSQDANLPLRLGMVVDVSDSVKRMLPDEKATALTFLKQIVRPGSDRVFLMAFGSEVKVWQDSTSNPGELVEAVGHIQQPGGGTDLYDALYSACTNYLARQEDGDRVQHAIVLISDGDDNHSLHGLGDAIAAAQRSETQIYSLTVHPRPNLFYRGDAVLQRLADETGGQFMVVTAGRDLAGAFAEIEKALRTQYSVSFRPQQNTPGFHALRVEVHAWEPLQVHARHGYYAAAD